MKTRLKLFVLIPISVAVLALTGCPPKKKLPIAEKKTDVAEATPTPQPSETPSNILQPGDVQINQDWTEVPALATINFDLDSVQLGPTQRAALKENVAILKKLPASVSVRVEGHCDNRGTVEYNIALGQRRADAVKSFYATAGLGKSRVNTISYGEERPICNENTEDCWSRNRRAVTTLKNDQPITIKADELK